MKKRGVIYPEAGHGPFSHVCTPERKSGATWFTILTASTLRTNHHDQPPPPPSSTPLLCLLPPPPPVRQHLPLHPHPPHRIALPNSANKTHWAQTTTDVVCAPGNVHIM